MNLVNKKKIYISCIAGMAMSAIAKYIVKSGFKGDILGCDINLNSDIVKDLLKNHGINVVKSNFQDFSKEELDNVDLYIYSSATRLDSDEMLFFKQKQISVLSRLDVIRIISEKYKKIINVTGSRGKTSTSSLLGFLMNQLGYNCDIICGGVMNNYSDGTYFNNNDNLVIEGDESDGTVFKIKTSIAIITNISSEHINHYNNDESLMINSYADWINNHVNDKVILCIDDINVQKLILKIRDKDKILKYSEKQNVDSDAYLNKAELISFNDLFINFSIKRENIYISESLRLKQNGIHFGINFLSILLAIFRFNANINWDFLQKKLNQYKGVFRRSTLQGRVNEAMIINDYAVHPEGIKYVIGAFRSLMKSENKIYSIFEPHRYSRFDNNIRIEEFIKSLSKSDIVIVIDIFSAGESGNFVTIKNQIMSGIVDKYQKEAIFLDDAMIKAYLKKNVSPDDVVIFFGAGRVSDLCIDCCENILEK